MAAGVLAAASALLDELRGFEPALLAGEDCAVIAERLAVVEKSCAVARGRAAVRAIDSGAHGRVGFPDPADWLARIAGSSRGDAKAALETAAALETMSEARDAAVGGKLSPGQAREIALTERTVPGSAGDLIEFAERNSFQSLRDEARRRRLRAIDAIELHKKQRAARSFRHWRDDLGMICFRGALPPDVGVPLVNRLDAETDRVRRSARRGGSVEPRDAHAADALVRLTEGNGRGRSRQADVVIVCDVNAWRRGHAHDGEPCHLIGGGPIPVEVAHALADDAFLKAVLHDGVAIHTVRHFGRHIPAELRTALDLGPAPTFDGVECTDGCGRRYGLQWDHVDPVANNGPTCFDNLEGRCWGCHREKTERDRAAGLLSPGRRERGP